MLSLENIYIEDFYFEMYNRKQCISILGVLSVLLIFPISNLGGGILECCRTTTLDDRLYFPTCAVRVRQRRFFARILKNSL